MEIRRIRPDESDQFLNLLCSVFGLDQSRAQGIFYNEPMYDLQRKWAMFCGNEMISILTTVPLEFGWGRAIGIAGVATNPSHQRKGYASRLLERVLVDAEQEGEPAALLFARAVELYEAIGFTKLDDVIRGQIGGCRDDGMGSVLEFDQVRPLYEQWALAHPARLRRDEQRWKYWRWTLRFCTRLDDGYACLEGNIMRECVTDRPCSAWPIGRGAEWFGTTHMAERLGLQLDKRAFDLHFMGYKIPTMPQMFMTDQF
ncbi:MAG: GNAT family N-acetyltransferase [Fimbriimonadaceae bacterium]